MNAVNHPTPLRDQLRTLSRHWIENGLPSRQILNQTAVRLTHSKKEQETETLWPSAPHMVTATIDDASGLGIQMIHQYAQLAGVRIHHLGLMIPPTEIIASCRQQQPDLLGLTVLQVDSEAALALVAGGLPAHTRLIAGGPAFRYDPDLAERCHVFLMAPNVAYFIDFLVNWTPVPDLAPTALPFFA